MLDMVRTTLNKLLGWCCAFNGAAEIFVSAVVGWSVCLRFCIGWQLSRGQSRRHRAQ